MLEELKEEAIVNKVGGRFKLATLIQKRLIALNKGAKPLVDLRTNDKMAIVIQEILQDKIYLDTSGNVQARNQTALANLPGAMFDLTSISPTPSTTTAAELSPRDNAPRTEEISERQTPPVSETKAVAQEQAAAIVTPAKAEKTTKTEKTTKKKSKK
ncbi:MAG: DNA-directed RNA polymerase subunit omega [Gemmataceae bacterium]|nr:DNA-directed RNA polymerase subunit omega [Gemmataceae bacterium]MCS7269465.1 DNA-directed RNA polymerase subunit omega [Gemmataceae bacterium]MDW8243954.1 DNA-directed RNA polymerase subunit omega [Thermogemmata sp.]